MTQLLRCPFCGKVPQINKSIGEYGYTPSFIFIKCCDIFMHEDTMKWEQGKGHFSIEDHAELRLIERWNTRKP